MRKILAFLLATCAAHAQVIPATGPNPNAFVPRDYYVLDEGRATGDLNGDGQPDVVLVLGPANEIGGAADDGTTPRLPPRLLLVLWRTAAGGYRLACTARRAILSKDKSGVYGDPFAGLEITKGVLTLYHHGGSNWRWSITAKFRYQQGSFYQVGDTYNLIHNEDEPCLNLPGDHRPGDNYHDVNLLTGQYERVRVSEECKFLENKRGRQPVRPLPLLVSYTPAL